MESSKTAKARQVNKAKVKKASKAMLKEFAKLSAKAFALLGIPESSTRESIIHAINQYVIDTVNSKKAIEIDNSEIFMLASLLADQYKSLNWEWVQIKFPEEDDFRYYVISPDHQYAYSPIYRVARQMREKDEITLALCFNMSAAGEFCPSEPGEITVFG